MRLISLLETVADTASRRGIPLVFLKFAALQTQGLVVAGSRPAADIDVLVPVDRVDELRRRLLEGGLVAGQYAPCEHHLAALRSPSGDSVELHFRLPGVRLYGRRSADAQELIESGHVGPAPGFPDQCLVPDLTLHAAYLIVHGFVQHGPFPGTYSLFWVIADLIDLSAAASAKVLPEDGVASLIRGEMSRADVAAILTLCDRLRNGDAALAEGVGEPSRELDRLWLQHIFARTLSPEYQKRLVYRTLTPISDDPKPLVLVRMLTRKLAPSRAHLDQLHGPSTGLRYLGRRIARPFDLFRRYRPGAVEKGSKIGEDALSLSTKRDVEGEPDESDRTPYPTDRS